MALPLIKYSDVKYFLQSEAYSDDIKVRRFPADTDDLIMKKYSDLSNKIIAMQLAEEEFWKDIFFNTKINLYRGIVGLHLSQDIQEIRLPVNVLNRAKDLCYFNRG